MVTFESEAESEHMRTDRDQLLRGIKFFGYTVALCFTAPFTIYQAFKNQGHPLYYPVLILGFILAIAAVVMGFRAIKTVVDAFFGKKGTASHKE